MLRIHLGRSEQYCDGVSRRSFLKLGSLSLGGMALGSLSLPQLLAAEARAGIKSSTKAVINVHLSGGPSHQDIFDLKPSAPAEFRGQFQPIATNVGGMDICEHLPKLANMVDKFAILCSLSGSGGQHSIYQSHSCYAVRD